MWPRARGETEQHQLDDALGKLIVDRPPRDQQPVEERPSEHVEGELDIEVGAQVAAVDAASQHLGQRGPPGGQIAAAEGPRQLWTLRHRITRFGINLGASSPL